MKSVFRYEDISYFICALKCNDTGVDFRMLTINLHRVSDVIINRNISRPLFQLKIV